MLIAIWWIWWWLWALALGLCVGSFTNVIVYRLPRDLHPGKPVWSFCPHCQTRIPFRYNIPILSFLWLNGRCKQCDQPISLRYPLIEMLTSLVFVILLDAFFYSVVRPGLSGSNWDLILGIRSDWPIYLAHVILFSCLAAMSAIDIDYYWVDVRFTWFATACGLVLHSLWTTKAGAAWPRPWDGTAAVTGAAMAGLLLAGAVRWFRRRTADVGGDDAGHLAAESRGIAPPDNPAEGRGEDAPAGVNGIDPVAGQDTPASPPSRGRMAAAWTIAAIFAALTGSVVLEILLRPVDEYHEMLAGAGFRIRAVGAAVALMAAIVGASFERRESDEQIVQVIEEERHGARSMALREFGILLPAVVFGLAAWFAIRDPGLARIWSGLLSWAPLAHWMPLRGLLTAVSGLVIAGAIGWTVRLFFTLLLGKEAFGVGDIHMMAAAGCVAGWPIVALGFFVSCLLALVGWLVMVPMKRTRAIPLGPWLSLGFFIVVLFYPQFLELRAIQTLVELFGYVTTGNVSSGPS